MIYCFQIDFGDISPATSSSNDFEVIDDGLNGGGGGGADIDWGEIEIVSSDTADFEVTDEMPTDDSGYQPTGVANGAEAYTLLDSPTYRDKVFDEIYEVNFLKP